MKVFEHYWEHSKEVHCDGQAFQNTSMIESVTSTIKLSRTPSFLTVYLKVNSQLTSKDSITAFFLASFAWLLLSYNSVRVSFSSSIST